MYRFLSLFAVTTMVAPAAPLAAQAPVRPEIGSMSSHFFSEGRLLPPSQYCTWAPVPTAVSGECTLDFQYAANMQSQTAFLRVFLHDDAFGLPSPDRLATVPVTDLTGWRTSLAELAKTPNQERAEQMYLIGHDHLPPIPLGNLDKSQVFNIAIGTEF